MLKFKNSSPNNNQNHLSRVPGLPMGVPSIGLPNQKPQTTPPSIPRQPAVSIPLPGEGLSRAVNYYADYGGCGHWRMIWPDQVINGYQKGVVMGLTAMIGDPTFYRLGLSSVKTQRQATPNQLKFFEFLRKVLDQTGGKLIYEVDDIIFKDDIPDFNRCKEAFIDDKIVHSAKTMMSIADEVTVTCDFMKEYYISKTGNKNIRVIPNYPPRFWGDGYYDTNKLLKRYVKNKKRPRIGYCGSGTHFDIQNKTNQQDDFAHAVDFIIKTRNDFKWVFMGGFPLKCKPYIDSGIMEYVKWSPILEYPRGIDNMDVSLTIAPLLDCTFNKAKSDIKFTEPAMLGIPAVCQDLITYKNCPFRFSTGSELIDQIKSVLKDDQTYIKNCKQVRKYVESQWLEDHIEEHTDVYFKKINESRPALKRLNPEIA